MRKNRSPPTSAPDDDRGPGSRMTTGGGAADGGRAYFCEVQPYPPTIQSDAAIDGSGRSRCTTVSSGTCGSFADASSAEKIIICFCGERGAATTPATASSSAA